MRLCNAPKRTLFIVILALLVTSIILEACGSSSTSSGGKSILGSQTAVATRTVRSTPTPSPTAMPTSTPAAIPTPSPTPVPTLPAVTNVSLIRGIQVNVGDMYTGISWVRLGYTSCGWGNLTGSTLKAAIDAYHIHGVRVLLTICQGPNDARLFDTAPLKDAAQGGADAVQCGNEEMKNDASVSFLYIPPANFARFYALCEGAVHAVRSDIPILLGSLDPHVAGADYQQMLGQASYLDQVQAAMNSSVHPGGNWNWHNATVGVIDSWHNGYPDASVNNLYGIFVFWAQRFGVDLSSGALGRHLWVVEGTGCFKGCGVDDTSAYQVAVSHILALITDVQTAGRYGIPFFFFTNKDFYSAGYYWPIGVLDANGNPKPLRQDLAMGARKLLMSCTSGGIEVANQEDLLARMYSGCSLQSNYVSVLTS